MPFVLTNKHFIGYIQADKDPENMGRYLVYIPELQPVFSERKGLWLKNDIAVYGDTQDHGKRYGQYFPLKAGTKVIVVFPYNDPNSGRIVRILNDDVPTASYSGTSMPPKEAKKRTMNTSLGKPPMKINIPFNAWEDRDDIYQIIRTPSDSLFVIGENTSDKIVPKDSIHLYYKKDHSKMVINNEGFNLITKRNLHALIEGNILINSSFGEMIFGNSFSLLTSSFIKLTSDKDDIHIFSGGSTYITAVENAVHITAPYSGRSLINISSAGSIFMYSNSKLVKFCNDFKYGYAKGNNVEYSGMCQIVMADYDAYLISKGKVTIAGDEVEIKASKLVLAYGSKVETGCSSAEVKQLRDEVFKRNVNITSETLELLERKFHDPERESKAKEIFKSRNELKERGKDSGSASDISMSKAIKSMDDYIFPPKVKTPTGLERPSLNEVMALEAVPTKVKEPSYIKFEDEQRVSASGG